MAAVKQSNWQSVQQNIWLILGVLSLIFALIFWWMTDPKELVAQNTQVEETQVAIQPEKVAATTNLGGLTEEVRPLQMTTRMVASGNHTAEFRGTKFVKENSKHYTVELFRVSNEDIIKSFLQKQADRKGLIYFRLSGENQAEQYVLAIGNHKNENAAKQQLTTLNMQLPASVKPKVMKFDHYVEYVNDLGSDELVGGNKLYQVRLKSVPVPVVDESVLARIKAEAKTAATDPAKATTTTTITRKDQAGKVVDVQRSQSSVEPQTRETKPTTNENKATDQQISDPFN